MPIFSLSTALAIGAALILGAVLGWVARTYRAGLAVAKLKADADARFLALVGEAQLARRELAEGQAADQEVAAEAAATAQAMARLENQLGAQATVADQFRAERDGATVEIERLRSEAEAFGVRAQTRENELRSERDRLAARVLERDAQLAKATEVAQADRALQTTELIDLRRRIATATEAQNRAATERETAERERQRLAAELSRREAEVRVTVVAQQAAFAEFRAELGSLQAQAERAEVLKAQLEDREILLRSLGSERETAAKAGRALEHDLDDARVALTRERSAQESARTAHAEAARRIEELEGRLGATGRDRDASQAAAVRFEREIATLREEIRERDVRFRALLEDRRAVVEAGLAEIARLRRELSRRHPSETTGADHGGGDDLRRISGIGPALESLLHANGVTTFRQIAGWSDADVDLIATKLGAFRDRIRREQWVEQAQRELDRRAGPPEWSATIG